MVNGRELKLSFVMILYLLFGLVGSLGYRLIWNQEPAPLAIYNRSWTVILSLIDFIHFFPALALSGIVAFFGFHVYEKNQFTRFSSQFLETMTKPIMGTIVASGIYGLLILLALPMALNARANMVLQGRLYTTAIQKATEEAVQKNWEDASYYYFGICKKIWPQNREYPELEKAISLGMEALRHPTNTGSVNSMAPEAQEKTVLGSENLLPGMRSPLNATDALDMAKQALREGRPYDAHWLATLGKRLAKEGSPEASSALQLAAQAWEAVKTQTPSAKEIQAYTLFQRKQEGYNALVSGDWIRGYYIFKDLALQNPKDSDVRNYLTVASQGLRQQAFFVDEIGKSLGTVFGNLLFSLPGENGRYILRLSTLSLLSDGAYGMGVELVNVDPSFSIRYTVTAPYGKIVPFTVESGEQDQGKVHKKTQLVLLLRAVDRNDSKRQWGAAWAPAPSSGMPPDQIVLPISFEDFTLAVRLDRGLKDLSIADLFNASQKLSAYGFIPQTFQAELLKRISEPMEFLILAVFMLALGWRLRATKKVGLLGIPMVALLPFVMNGITQILGRTMEIAGQWMVLTQPFAQALPLFIALDVGLLLAALIFLAGQQG